ncbi:MAG: type I methionyl aminopeptidase [Clostridiaceae bacterium]
MIIIKSDEEIEKMRKAGKVVGDTLNMLQECVKPGISTLKLDQMAEEYMVKCNSVPSFKGYQGFPGSLCTSLNYEVVHGIPSEDVILKEGDIISVDCGAILNGYQGDAARTFPVGKISKAAEDLINVTRDSFFKGVENAIVGNRLTDISAAVQFYAESKGYSVVREYVGHGIGKDMHEDPEVPNYGRPGRGPKLIHGMVLAIEPMINIGSYHVSIMNNGWTVATADRSLSGHYENTVAILNNGPEILTLC